MSKIWNCLPHFVLVRNINQTCFCPMLSLPEEQVFAQSFACLGGARLRVWFCWSSFANRDNGSSRVGDCENGTKLSVGSAEAPWISLFLPCVASPAMPSAFNGVGGGAVNQRSTLVAMLLRFGKKQFGNSNDFCCFKAVLQIKKQR